MVFLPQDEAQAAKGKEILEAAHLRGGSHRPRLEGGSRG